MPRAAETATPPADVAPPAAPIAPVAPDAPAPPPGERFAAVDERLRLPALARIVGTAGADGLERARAFVTFAGRQEVRVDRAWSALDDQGRPVATVLVVPNPGRTGLVFCSPARGPAEIARLGRLLDHACRRLDPDEVQLAQALVETGEVTQQAALSAGGFTELARLAYLERPLGGDVPPVPRDWPAGATLEAWCEALRPEFRDVLVETYEDTLDCPGLRGLRDPDDVLDGHMGSGRFDPRLWTLLRIDGRASGVVLLNPSPASGTVELVYLGLAPRARGRGLARRLLEHGLSRLAGRGERAVTLAVDLRNEPALALYRSMGFRRVLRRVAYIRPLARG